MKDDFSRAFYKLIGTYLLIIGGVIGLFSILVVFEAEDSLRDPSVQSRADLRTSAQRSIELAVGSHPGSSIEETEYEIEHNTLLYTVSFTDGTEIKRNMLTDEVVREEQLGLLASLADEFSEQVGWLGLIVFLISSVGATYVAYLSLRPIDKNMKKQKQFVSDAAHELRNPLAALHARIESTLRTSESDQGGELLRDLLGEVKKLIATCKSLLSLDRSSVKKVCENVNVEMVALSVVNRLQEPLREKNIQVNIESDETLLRAASSDIESILFNLVHNALKFSYQDGRVTVRWKDKTLEVQDEGVGIAPEHFPHLFERFYKADPSRGAQSEGSGLGLALVSDIVQSYDATIEVESELHKRTLIRIRF